MGTNSLPSFFDTAAFYLNEG